VSESGGDPGSQGRPVIVAVGVLGLGAWTMWILGPMNPTATAVGVGVLLLLIGVVVVAARRHPPSELPPSPLAAESVESGGSARVDLVRERGRMLGRFPLVVVVDGHEVASLSNGSGATLWLEPGSRHVRAHCSSIMSEALILECSANSVHEITFTAPGSLRASIALTAPIWSVEWGIESRQLDSGVS
jgi:hypothetical protein